MERTIEDEARFLLDTSPYLWDKAMEMAGGDRDQASALLDSNESLFDEAKELAESAAEDYWLDRWQGKE